MDVITPVTTIKLEGAHGYNEGYPKVTKRRGMDNRIYRISGYWKSWDIGIDRKKSSGPLFVKQQKADKGQDATF